MKQKYCFTLVELLIVVLVIAILVAMMSPAMYTVRDFAKRYQCQSNGHQIGIASVSYPRDNDDWYTPSGMGANVTPRTHKWGGRAIVSYDDMLSPYVGNPLKQVDRIKIDLEKDKWGENHPFRCPCDERPKGVKIDDSIYPEGCQAHSIRTFSQNGTSRDCWNSRVFSNEGTSVRRTSELKKPGRVFYLTERFSSANCMGNGDSSSSGGLLNSNIGSSNNCDYRGSELHKSPKQFNTVFCDGSATFLYWDILVDRQSMIQD